MTRSLHRETLKPLLDMLFRTDGDLENHCLGAVYNIGALIIFRRDRQTDDTTADRSARVMSKSYM